jgi:hypothetical protein
VSARELPPQTLVDRLKHPCSAGEARRLVLDQLARSYHRPFADPWDFVAYAQQQKLGLDLPTPPAHSRRLPSLTRGHRGSTDWFDAGTSAHFEDGDADGVGRALLRQKCLLVLELVRNRWHCGKISMSGSRREEIREKSVNQRPTITGLLLCEQVIVDDKTHHVTPVNCFAERRVEGPISKEQTFFVFALLTDGQGEMAAEVGIDRLDNLENVYRKRFPVRFDHPLQQFRCIVRVRELVFPVTGGFQASLTVDGECLAVRRFLVAAEED